MWNLRKRWPGRFALAGLMAMASATALVVGVPSDALASRVGLRGAPRAIASCVLESLVTTIAYRALVPFARTGIDHAVVPVLCLVFFGVFYASYDRGAEKPKKPTC